ncbi:MAG: hypothetical protein EOP08_07165, partial [Proteobacteria bacterium]
MTTTTASLRRSGRVAASVLGALTVLGLAHCSSSSDGGAPAGSSGSTSDASGSGSPDGASSSGGSCTPKTCAETTDCGTYDDGCGGSLSCTGTCSCTPNDFESVCPPRPCETLAGCTEGKCAYQPVTCGDAADP